MPHVRIYYTTLRRPKGFSFEGVYIDLREYRAVNMEPFFLNMKRFNK